MFARRLTFLLVCTLPLPAVVECCSGARTFEKDKRCRYELSVKTANEKGAGTDKLIKVGMAGAFDKPETGWITIDNENRDDFEQNHIDIFAIETKCFKSPPCIYFKNEGNGVIGDFTCTYDQWKLSSAKLTLLEVGRKVKFSAKWTRIYKFDRWISCPARKSCGPCGRWSCN